MKERPILFSGAMVRAILDGRKTQTRRAVKAREPISFIGGRGEENDPGKWGWFFDGPEHHGYMVLARGMNQRHDHGCISIPCPYGEPGDRLWVRETWALEDCGADGKRVIWQSDRAARWVGDGKETVDSEIYYLPSDYNPGRWRPSIHIPRKHSRLTLEVTEVRVERLQEISEDDARAEGVAPVIHEHWTAYDPETEGYPSFGVEPDAELIARKRLENVRHHGPKVLSTARQQFERLWESINGERPGSSWEANPWVWCVSFRRVT